MVLSVLTLFVHYDIFRNMLWCNLYPSKPTFGVVIPIPPRRPLPRWLWRSVESRLVDGRSGTIDRLAWCGPRHATGVPEDRLAAYVTILAWRSGYIAKVRVSTSSSWVC